MKLKEVFSVYKHFYTLFLRPYRLALLNNIFWAFVACLLEFLSLGLIIPILSKFIPGAHVGQGYYNFRILLIGIVALFLVKNVVLIGYTHLNAALSARLESDLTLRILTLMQNAHYGFLLKFSSDHWLNLVSQVCESTAGSVLQILQCFVNLALLATLLVFLAIHMPLFMGASLILFIAYAKGMALLNRYDCRQAISYGNPLSEWIINREQSFLLSIKELYILRMADRLIECLKPAIKRRNHILHRLDFVRYLPSYIFEMVVAGCLGITGWISIQWYGFENTLVNLGVWSVCIVRFIPFVNRITTAWYSFYPSIGYVADLNRDYEALLAEQRREERTIPPVDLDRTLTLENVCFGYRAHQYVLKDINLSIPPRAFVGIVGKSGAGKTTLVDILLGLLFPSSGVYKVGGECVTQLVSDQLGYVAQAPCIINGTVEENILFNRDKDEERLAQCVQWAQLEEFDLQFKLLEMGKNISGGQKQRIAIARALYNNPKLLVLDEVTASLDIGTEQKISEAINGLKGKCTVIAIAHRLKTLKHCDRIFYLKAGRIDAEGSFEDLYRTSPDFKGMVDQSNEG